MPAPGGKRPARPRARGSLAYGALAIAGGLVLAESLFLPWYSLNLTVGGVDAASTHSAWQVMSVMDVLLLLTALAAIAGGVVVARRGELHAIPLAAGAAGLVLSLLGLFDLPESGLAATPGDSASVGREAGPFVALVASAGIAFAGFAAMRRRAPGRGRARGSAGPRSAPFRR
ncbi:MAG TPA: hypothetical protein VG126_11880, partial [Thermoleophilaceae bacterium]|nr:hypothetical protein [Thermoleophilaceae bacterium]